MTPYKDPEKKRAHNREYMRIYNQKPSVKAKKRAYAQREDVKERRKKTRKGKS